MMVSETRLVSVTVTENSQFLHILKAEHTKYSEMFRCFREKVTINISFSFEQVEEWSGLGLIQGKLWGRRFERRFQMQLWTE